MFDLQLWTAQRASDVVRMKWSHIRNDIISVATQVKTGARVEIPVAAPLQCTLDAWKERSTGDTILVGQKGRPFTRDRYTHLFGEA